MHNIDYLEQGEGETVILLHSTAAGNKQWRKLIDTLSPKFRVVAPNLYGGAVRLTSPSISIRMTAIFYEVTKERHSVRAASRLSLNVLRFESDLCELNRL